jgi:transposase
MKLLIEEGLSITEVARRLGCSRQTIYNNMDREIDEAEPRRRPSKLDDYRKHIEMRLERFDLPATVLLREIREQGYEGGITILREAVAEIKDRHVQKVVDRFETEPGRQAQVDWGSCGTIWHQGRRRKLSLLVVVLGFSRTIWARFVVSERRPVLTTLLEQAFSELGGVPRELLFDNLKAVIARPRSEDAPAVVQPGFADFADHWGFEACACPPYWPRAKGKVERAVGYVKTSFLEGRSFDDLEDLNAQLRVWLATVANVRRHGTTGERPVDRLAAEQAKMLDLVTPYPKNEVEKRLADWDSRISFRGVRYSVDPSILGARRGTPVEVHLGSDERLRIHYEGRLVGEHVLAPKGSPPQDDPAHARARRQLREGPSDRVLGRAPRFEQREQPQPDWTVMAPAVAARSLYVYEEALPCNQS